MLISSGFYVHPNSQYSVDWVGRALRRQLRWCRDQDVEYDFLASTMGTWGKLATWPGSWTFGTLLKFESIRRFLDSPRMGDRYFWMDIDVYPSVNASINDLLELPSTSFFAPKASPSFCGFPGEMDPNHAHMYCKLVWAGTYRREFFHAASTGMFSLTRSDAERFWAWLNRDFSIDSPEWWAAYRDKQMRCSVIVQELGNEGVSEHWFGSEEMIIEEWLNSEQVYFGQIDTSVTHLVGMGNPKFVHYYGITKNQYPEI
jgi:hypothetical protein